MKLLSLFSGIGAFEKALDNLEMPYELVAYCEIDKYASKSYSAIHNVPESMNLGDITRVDEKALPKDIDLVTYGFPCQDISLAGKQKGLFNTDGTQTRSGLFFEALRIIEETQPRVAIAENVKNLTSKKFNAQFQIVLESLEQAGYNNYWQVLNAKDYGIPQNRERVFIVSIRKDIDTGMFQFPEGFPLELRLKDMLEDVVDEKYYLKSKDTSVFKMFDSISGDTNGCIQVGNLDRPTTHDFSNRVYSPDGLARTLMGSGGNQNDKAGQYLMRIDIPQTVKVRKYPVDTDTLCETLRYHKALVDQNNNGISNALGVPVTKVEHWFRRDECFAIPDPDVWFKLKELLGITTDEFDESIMTFEEKEGVYEKSERHYFADGISPTLTSTSAGNEKILVREATKLGYAEAYEGDSINLEQPNSKTRRGIVGHGVAQTLTTSPQQAVVEPSFVNGDICRTVQSGGHGSTDRHSWDMVKCNSTLRIRKLTPKECFRLMGFNDSDFEKAEAVNSNTQLYKQAGNSICVPGVEYITKALIDAGIFGDEPKPYQFTEGQIYFTDCASFDRYIEAFRRE